jgi:hypothetical protein
MQRWKQTLSSENHDRPNPLLGKALASFSQNKNRGICCFDEARGTLSPQESRSKK